MQSTIQQSLTQLNNNEFVASIPQLFDIDNACLREEQWVAYRLEASRRKIVTEFDRLYNAYAKELNRSLRNGDFDMRYGFALESNGRGGIATTINNFVAILDNDPAFAGIKFNLMTDAAYIDGRKWQDSDDAWLRNEIEIKYHIHSRVKLEDAFRVILRKREYHPVRALIDSFVWDGKSRIYTLLNKWLKCEDTEYTREVSRLIFAGGIHRIYQPGCQFDDVPVLIGTKQGEGKTSFLRWLAIDPEFFGEVKEIDGQKGAEALEGKWICAFDELLAMTRAREQEAVKSYITRCSDHYRRPYARYTSETPRQCIFLGTTNHRVFIADKTGGRRFYPIVVKCNGYELHDQKDAIAEDIKQCWAEAKHMYDRGELLPCAKRELIDEIRAEQADATEDDYRIAEIEEWLRHKGIGELTCIKQLWVHALKMPEDRPITTKDSRDIGLIMQNMPNWERVGNKSITGYGKPKAWQRVAPKGTG